MGRINKKRALKLLDGLLAERKGETVFYSVFPQRRIKWERNARVVVQAVFGQDSEHVAELESCFKQRDPWREADRCATLLESMIYEIKNTWFNGEHDADVAMEDVRQETAPSSRLVHHPDSNKVFLVHGHDREVKETVARFLENKNLKVVILDEEPGQGRTIIEKFEAHSSVGYAVVLMTPDDAAECRGGGAPAHRARQNVVFELGFFVGVLKRRRVCVIAKGDLEIPSDYWGVEYIQWDEAGGWQIKLLRELKAAELDIREAD